MDDKSTPGQVDRRSFIRGGAAGLYSAASMLESGRAAERPVRIGIVGVGPRGQSHLKNLLANHPDVEIKAICDVKQDRLQAALNMVETERRTRPVGYSKGEYDYRNLCERQDLDGVLVVTPVNWLVPISLDALRAGKNAALEVSGAQTEEECWDLVHTKEKTGKHLMFLENCCYGNENMMVFSMINQGVLGEPYYAEGSYVHDCRFLFFEPDGKITWRGEMQRDRIGSTYPQHGLGSTCKWLAINDGDTLVECQTMMVSPREAHLRAVAQFGPNSGPAAVSFREGDIVSSLISTAKGRMIRIDYGISCTRPYSRYYLMQGTKGCWDSRSGIYVTPDNREEPENWSPVSKYQPQYEHSYWKESAKSAQTTGGHGGIDYFVISEFVRMLREDREPWIDVYDCATWSSLIYCSKLSLDRNGARVKMPDFTGGRWKTADWRKGRIPLT